MRYTEIQPIVTSKKIDKRKVRNAVRDIRSLKADSAKRYNVIFTLPAPLDEYFMRMKVVSRKSWAYVADRMESTLLAKRV